MHRYRSAVILSCLVSLLGCKPASEAPADAADAAPKKGEAEAPAKAAIPEDLDLVILNGRVMDPETKLDAVRNVGIKGGKIVTITEQAIKGSETKRSRGVKRSTPKATWSRPGSSIPTGMPSIHSGERSGFGTESPRVWT
jgi:hypothetical protein